MLLQKTLPLLTIILYLTGTTVGQCPTSCNDSPPDPEYVGQYQYSCQEQKEYGQCNADFMVGYCECTCRTCAALQKDNQELPQVVEEAAKDTASPVKAYPFLEQMNCAELLILIQTEIDLRYEFELYDGLDKLFNNKDVQECIYGIGDECDSDCCIGDTTQCGCDSFSNNCAWTLSDKLSIQYFELKVFENGSNQQCRCPTSA
eukprot:TRINITY_DN3678_c1_g1_i1.p1 TRINITY_DN3678_c1_g1~~TRINITY_DN3678_c1_g1_i1.p1  ORF type:complete len:221 (+),score=21.83 TRINITY_DN3678_c1_g1_i1:57-665(+)